LDFSTLLEYTRESTVPVLIKLFAEEQFLRRHPEKSFNFGFHITFYYRFDSFVAELANGNQVRSINKLPGFFIEHIIFF